MLLPALIALSIAQQQSHVRYHLIQTTEAKSPHLEQATLIQDKRKAYDSLMLVKDGSPKPLAIRKINWHKNNVLILYPGLVQKDSRYKIVNIKKFGKTLQVAVDWHHGISAKTYYPMLILVIPKQPKGTETTVFDPNRYRSSLRLRGRSLGS